MRPLLSLRRPAPGRRLGVISSLVVAALALGTPSWGRAQDTLPARELRHGDRMARDGKLEQAQEAWRGILTRYPDAPEASAALERLAARAYPVATFEERGTRPDADFDEGLRLLQRLAEDYRQAPEAPGALFRLGLLRSDPASPRFDLDQAYARFSQLVTIHPDSALRPAGLFGLGDVLFRQGDYGRVLAPLARLDAEFPGHERAAQGLWLQAESLVRLERLRAALRTYQDLRDRYPGSPLADRARDRNTHLVRLLRLERQELYGAPALIRPGLDEEWRIRSLSDLAVDFRHHIALADERGDAIHLLDPAGRPLGRSQVTRPAAICMGGGSLVAHSADGLWRDGEVTELRMTDGKTFPGTAGMLALDGRGRLVLWDRRSGDLLRFDGEGRLEATLARARDGRIDAAASCESGAYALLDSREGVVRMLDGEGAEKRIYLPRNGLRRPENLACDFLENLYIMDRSSRDIMVVAPDGSMLARLSSGRDDRDPFPRPVDLAVSSRGSILVYDERRQGVVVFP